MSSLSYSKISRDSAILRIRETQSVNDAAPTVLRDNQQLNVYVDNLNGIRNPNWREKIRLGRNATTSLSADEISLSGRSYGTLYKSTRNSGTGTRRKVWKTEAVHYLTDFNIPTASSISDVSARNMAKSRVVKKIKEQHEQFSGSTFLGELRETLRMIRRPASSLRSGFDDYLKLVKKRASERRYVKRRDLNERVRKNLLNKMIAGTWLEFQFGVKPLLSDIDSAAQALARIRVESQKRLKRVSGEGSSETSSVYYGTQYEGLRIRKDEINRCTVRYYGAIRPDFLTTAGRNTMMVGLSPTSFVPTIWELVPWSFVVDYFTNIQEIIDAYSYGNLSVAWLSHVSRKIKTLRCTSEFDHQGWVNSLPAAEKSGAVSSLSPSTWTWERKIVSRAQNTDSLVPTFEWDIPGSRSLKWANLSALALSLSSTSRALRK